MAPVGAVLRYVENRRVISTKEAEKEMKEIVRDLFKYEAVVLSILPAMPKNKKR
jgi:hypothetical protein